MRDAPRYRLDELRRFATALGTGVGMAPARAAAFAAHLLWFDAAGAPDAGIASLPAWLERITNNDVDPRAEATVVEETLGTAVLDGQGGVPPLILARAGELAVEKARDAGTGLVRVTRLGPMGPAAAVASDMAVGPVVALLLGPGPSWTIALPSDEGLPALHDSALANSNPPKKGGRGARPAAVDAWASWASVIVPDGDWLVAAIGVKAIEPLSAFQARVGARFAGAEPGDNGLAPVALEARRREVREHGAAVTEAVQTRLNEWAARFGVGPLTPASPSPPAPRSAL